MLQRERRRDREQEAGAGDPSCGSAGNARQTAEMYYNAVDDAISRALSSNSELFNVQVEQENGQ